MEYRRQGSVGRVGPALRQQHRDSLAGLLGLLIVHANEVRQRSPAEAGGIGQRQRSSKGACLGCTAGQQGCIFGGQQAGSSAGGGGCAGQPHAWQPGGIGVGG